MKKNGSHKRLVEAEVVLGTKMITSRICKISDFIVMWSNTVDYLDNDCWSISLLVIVKIVHN